MIGLTRAKMVMGLKVGRYNLMRLARLHDRASAESPTAVGKAEHRNHDRIESAPCDEAHGPTWVEVIVGRQKMT